MKNKAIKKNNNEIIYYKKINIFWGKYAYFF